MISKFLSVLQFLFLSLSLLLFTDNWVICFEVFWPNVYGQVPNWSLVSFYSTSSFSILSFPCGSAGKESACNAGYLDSIPGLGRSPGEGKRYPLQYSGLENSMGCTVHGVTKSWTWLSNFHFLHFHSLYLCFHPSLQIGSVPFLRFHVYALTYNIWFSLSDLLHSV